MEDQTDEDRIIENILIEGTGDLFEDIDFLPSRQSLYNNETVIPEYDDEIFQRIEWCRPHAIFDKPSYFNPTYKQLSVHQGSLPDSVFLGTLMAISAYTKHDLIQNIFASRPDDFLKYGIYTCRFYVDGDWVEVITDTSLPCLKHNITGKYRCAYGNSDNPGELWVALVEKAFAKAMGSYEEIPNIKVQKALLHLTGGSIQHINLKDETAKNDNISDVHAWNEFKRRIDNDSIFLVLPVERKVDMVTYPAISFSGDTLAVDHSNDVNDNHTKQDGDTSMSSLKAGGQAAEYFIPDMLYSVIGYKDIGGYELILMHNPWDNGAYSWTGEWSDTSNEWDLFPDLLHEIENDPAVLWKRKHPQGYFWISFRNFTKHFHKGYCCKLFPDDKFNFYCVRGECRGKQASGPLQTLRDHDTVIKDAAASKTHAIQKATAASVIDGDASWFNNPEYRLQCSATTIVYISVIPLGGGEDEHDQASNIFVTVTRSIKGPSQPAHLWDVSGFEVFATDKSDPSSGLVRVKGQETSIWGLTIDHKYNYHIKPNLLRKGIEGDFILRVFASKPVVLEGINPLESTLFNGEWRKVGDLDTTGGPLKILNSDGSLKDNPKWCQNPQYHVEIGDPYGKEDVYLKIVLRRIDKNTNRSATKHSQGQSTAEQKKMEATVGLVVCKADVLEDSSKKIKKRQPRQNILGEPILAKATSLKKPANDNDEDAKANANPASYNDAPKVILRKLHIEPSDYSLVSTYSSKTESCIFFPKLPRAWMPNGIIVVPSLNEKAVKGQYELEVFSSERVLVNQLPETFSRTLAGDWTEQTAGGCHLSSMWKKNPKFILKFHYPVGNMEPSRIRITLARHGISWRNMCKKDTVGCMIGFYIFVNNPSNNDELPSPIFESVFSPDQECSTEPSFALEQLNHNESYTIMPCTFGEGKVGSFVLSILSEFEFTINKEK
eukprot:gene6934-9488_t